MVSGQTERFALTSRSASPLTVTRRSAVGASAIPLAIITPAKLMPKAMKIAASKPAAKPGPSPRPYAITSPLGEGAPAQRSPPVQLHDRVD